ncbi:MAG: methyltransferase domain-containing protein [archaeon]
MYIEYHEKGLFDAETFRSKVFERTMVNYGRQFLWQLPQDVIEERAMLLQEVSLEGGNDFSFARAGFEDHINYMMQDLLDKFPPRIDDPKSNGLVGLDVGFGPKGLSLKYLPQDRFSVLDGLDISYANIEKVRPLAAEHGWNLYWGAIHNLQFRERYDIINCMSSLDGTRFLEPAFESIAQALKVNRTSNITQNVSPGIFSTLGLEFDERRAVGYVNPIECGIGYHDEILTMNQNDRNPNWKTAFSVLQNCQEKAAKKAGLKIEYKGTAWVTDYLPKNPNVTENVHEWYFVDHRYYDSAVPPGLIKVVYCADILVVRKVK